MACNLMLLSMLLPTMTATALDWSVNEVHVQYGELDVPAFKPGPKQDDTLILTFKHASVWTYGDSFLFVDWLDGTNRPGIVKQFRKAFAGITQGFVNVPVRERFSF